MKLNKLLAKKRLLAIVEEKPDGLWCVGYQRKASSRKAYGSKSIILKEAIQICSKEQLEAKRNEIDAEKLTTISDLTNL